MLSTTTILDATPANAPLTSFEGSAGSKAQWLMWNNPADFRTATCSGRSIPLPPHFTSLLEDWTDFTYFCTTAPASKQVATCQARFELLFTFLSAIDIKYYSQMCLIRNRQRATKVTPATADLRLGTLVGHPPTNVASGEAAIVTTANTLHVAVQPSDTSFIAEDYKLCIVWMRPSTIPSISVTTELLGKIVAFVRSDTITVVAEYTNKPPVTLFSGNDPYKAADAVEKQLQRGA